MYVVKIPFRTGPWGPERLGVSKNQSMARFLQLERRFSKDEKLRDDYVKVMKEYIALGQMVSVDNEPNCQKLYYIPHHAVVKPDRLTTKTRVVFDASAKTSTGYSLNECIYTGAKQQRDLWETMIKWRTHKIVFKADIEKMYRMIKLDKEDQRYHTVLWRDNPLKPVQEFQLTTATFGTAAAPFMATRTLIQLAEDVGDKFPLASEIMKEDFNVDDLISGCGTLEDAPTIKEQIIAALKEGGFSLRKWTSNTQEVLDSLPADLTERSLHTFEDDTTTALGLQWNPKTDKFSFKISFDQNNGELTKRRLLSEASKIFDPLGWLAPVVLNPKLIMQQIWDLKVEWDEKVPADIATRFRSELPSLSSILVNRWINYQENSEVELHGFCDASEKAYAAVVYTKIVNGGRAEIRLVASKTRVAPKKTKTTLPRLELCGAVLLSHLLKSTKESLQNYGMVGFNGNAWMVE